MQTLRDHTLAWLESIGADGLIDSQGEVVTKEDIKDGNLVSLNLRRVPAYRHADGSYHTTKEIVEGPCRECIDENGDWCLRPTVCNAYKQWLANKEPPSAARR